MVWQFALFLGGGWLAALTLRDFFRTVVVPGESHGILRVARRLLFLTLPIWKAARRGRRGLSTGFAPFVLVGSFVIWMLLLCLGVGAMLFALRQSFRPPLTSFAEAVYAAGNSVVTMGLGATEAAGWARWIVLFAGFCGLGVMTLTVTYLLEVQNGVTRRDAEILKLNTSSGDPPSALASLEKHAQVGARDFVPEFLRGGRDWCTAVGQSHASHPSLIYFRSIGVGAGWPAALGAFLDLALITELLLDPSGPRGAAVLLREEGTHMAESLMGILRLKPGEFTTAPAEVAHLADRIRAAGYPLSPYKDWQDFATRRDRYTRCVAALADHLGAPPAPLIPQPDQQRG
jgi:hypothetical protein